MNTSSFKDLLRLSANEVNEIDELVKSGINLGETIVVASEDPNKGDELKLVIDTAPVIQFFDQVLNERFEGHQFTISEATDILMKAVKRKISFIKLPNMNIIKAKLERVGIVTGEYFAKLKEVV